MFKAILILTLLLLIVVPVTARDGDHENVELVSSIYDYWEGAYDVEVSGDYAYIATGATGFRILDISDINNPEEVANIILSVSLYDIDISGNYAYVAYGNYNSNQGSDGGLKVIDISDPSFPVVIESFNTDYGATSVVLDGIYAYLSGPSLYFTIIDISNPEHIEEVGIEFDDGTIFSVSGNYAYMTADDNLIFKVIDISDPTNPTEISYSFIDEFSIGLNVIGNYAFILGRGWGESGSLQVYDISDPENPVDAANFAIDADCSHAAISGDLAYITTYENGIIIVDISDPLNMTEVGSYDTEEAYSIHIFNDNAYLGDKFGIRILDFTDPLFPTDVTNFAALGDIHDLSISGDHAYLVDKVNGMFVVDVSDSGNPFEVASIEIEGKPNSISISGEYAYIAGRSEGMLIYNISEPNLPVEVAVIDVFGGCLDVVASGNYVYSCDGFSNLKIYDISDPISPEYLGGHDLNSSIVDIAVLNDIAYVVTYDSLFIVDVSDPENPQEVNVINIWGHPRALAVDDNYAYIAAYPGSLRIFNISDPIEASEIGFCDTEGEPSGIAISGDQAYVVENENGLQVINIANPTNPYITGFYDIYGVASNVVVSGDLAYVADKFHFEIFDCSVANSISFPDSISLISPADYATIEANEVELIWSESSENVDEYVVWYSTDHQFIIDIDSLSVADTSCFISGLQDQTTYYWKVRAQNDSSPGVWSVSYYRFTVQQTSVDDELDSGIPKEFAINSAYPNPFNPSLTAVVGLPMKSNLKVVVYNIMGREVAELTNRQHQTGYHSFVLDGAGLSSGVYFVHAIVPGKLNQVQKIVLMK
jgi:hypothetical protein